MVLNAGNRTLLFYSATGAYQRAAGREGRGPGEFRNPTWLGRGGGDTLLVWDAGLSRLSTFNGAGRLLDTRQVGFRDGSAVSTAIRDRFADGSFLALPGPLVFLTGAEQGVIRFAEPYQRYDPLTDRTTPLAEGQSPEMVFGERGGSSLPFGRRGFALAFGNLLLVADNGLPELRFHGLDGTLRRVVRWVAEPVAVTSADRAAHEKHAASESGPTAPADHRYASERPRFSSIHIDRLGWIWVRKYGAEWEPPASWLVFDPAGMLQCEVTSPGRISVLEIGADYVLALRRDDAGEESVVRYGIMRTTPPPAPGR